MSDRAIVHLENGLCAGKLPEFVCAEWPCAACKDFVFLRAFFECSLP